mmetsp:Transcript_24976/g.60083  ORF Transcript_24976/g.60083 Transcript_24976/m.60083 type:complete len:235 (+) Transcript_24976:2180-2884(+)
MRARLLIDIFVTGSRDIRRRAWIRRTRIRRFAPGSSWSEEPTFSCARYRSMSSWKASVVSSDSWRSLRRRFSTPATSITSAVREISGLQFGMKNEAYSNCCLATDPASRKIPSTPDANASTHCKHARSLDSSSAERSGCTPMSTSVITSHARPCFFCIEPKPWSDRRGRMNLATSSLSFLIDRGTAGLPPALPSFFASSSACAGADARPLSCRCLPDAPLPPRQVSSSSLRRYR